VTGAGAPPLLVLAAALLAWSPGNARTAERLRWLTAPRRAPRRTGTAALRSPWQRRLLAGLTGAAVGLVVGGATGAVGAVAAGLAVDRLLRRAGTADGALPAAARLRDLPVACDLLAVCLAAGQPVGAALAAVAEAVPGPLGGPLQDVAGLYRLGAEPGRAWSGVPGELAPLGRVLVRSGESGSAAGPALRSLAADVRAAARTRIEGDVRRAGVWVLAPLGLCFLPAFVCLGVVPLVLGIAGQVFR